MYCVWCDKNWDRREACPVHSEPGGPAITERVKLWKHERRMLVYDRDGWACLLCGDDDPRNLTLDHIIPRALGGEGTVDNLQTLCAACNQEKGTDVWDIRAEALASLDEPIC